MPFDEDSPEVSLAAYWRQRIAGGRTDFDLLLGIHHDSRGRPAALDLSRQGHWRELPFNKLLDEIAIYIVAGAPLSRAEFYLALAVDFLATDADYEDFFRTHWHETATHCGYCASADCGWCLQEASKLKERNNNDDGRENPRA